MRLRLWLQLVPPWQSNDQKALACSMMNIHQCYGHYDSQGHGGLDQSREVSGHLNPVILWGQDSRMHRTRTEEINDGHAFT